MKKIFTHLCLRPLFLLVALLCVGGSSVWGDTVLFSTNFSTADGWTTEDIITSTNTEATRTIKGTTISFKGYKSQNLSVTAGEGSANGSLTFTKSGMEATAGETTDSNPNYYMAIPVTGVKGKLSVSIKVSSYTYLAYTYDDGNKGRVAAKLSSGSSSEIKFTISGLENDDVTLYIGCNSASICSINSISISTLDLYNLSEEKEFYFYTNSSVTAATLISNANLPPYISINSITSTESSATNNSTVSSPLNFTELGTGTYYRLKPSSSSSIVITGLSHVKSIRFYGNASSTGKIKTSITKLLGNGAEMTVQDVDYTYYSGSYRNISEFSIGDLTQLVGYNADTYYQYTITFTAAFSLWGIYIEPATTLPTVNAPTGLSCTAQTKNSLTFEWTEAENASSYDVTLYSDSECTDQVATDNVTTTSKTFTGLSGSTTYYCKVQSKGDGSTYAENGGVTEAVSGTTTAKDYTLTVASNNDSYGTAAAVATSLDADETTTITATAETGYKFRNWTVSGAGATLTSTTTNPTTLTMGTGGATVTANFSALETYTITYNKGAGTGTISNGVKTEDVDFTLSYSKFTRSGYVQTGWATSEDGEKAYDLGGTYTGNANLDLYPYWTEQYTITYNSNGGEGTMDNTEGLGSITLDANTYTKSGYTFIGWATSKDNADTKTVDYADKGAYTLSADATLYAVWAENYCEMKPATTGAAPTEGSITMQPGAFGGTMTIKSSVATLNYTSYGLSSFSGKTTLEIVLNDYMKPGSVISLTLYGGTAGSRGFDLYTSDGTKITTFAHTSAGYATYQYTVRDDDGLDGTYSFQLTKETYTAMIYLTSLTVTDCQPGGVITASGWSTYSSNKKLDLSTISGGTAYVAVADEGNRVKMKPCTDIVAAETGLMIKGTAGNTFTINTTTSEATLSMENLMVGLPNGGTVAANDESYNNYVFGWPTASGNPANDCRFYYVNSSAATLGAGKSYLRLAKTNGSARQSLFIDDDNTTTGITNAKGTTDANHNYFDLQGRKVAKPTKGLYIENGKKVVVK